MPAAQQSGRSLPRESLISRIFDRSRTYLLEAPDRLTAAKVCAVISLMSIPLFAAGHPFHAISLSLGALAGALSETDDHPRGRVKALLLKTVAFVIASVGVELARNSTLLLAAGLGLSTVICILIGGISERYRGITFGTLLVGLYTMIGAAIAPAPYWQPILLPSGALFYGLFSLWLLRLNPWRLLDEQLARGYMELARYLETKAQLFVPAAPDLKTIRNSLAVINQQLVLQLDGCRALINNYRDDARDSSKLQPYLLWFMLLQSLHERAASSHQRYDKLTDEPAHLEILTGIASATEQLAVAIRQFGQSLLTGKPFHYPAAFDWLITGLKTQAQKQRIPGDNPLHLIINNLARSGISLYNLQDDRLRELVPKLARDNRSSWQRFKAQLSWENGRMRYALRLAICFVVGFTIAEIFAVAKGEWIVLTSLFVCQPSYGETRRKIYQRIMGTLAGVLGGLMLIQLLPTIAGKTLLLLLSTYTFFLWLRRNYAVAVVFVTIIVICAFDLMTGAGAAVMLPRILDTVLGSSLALLSVRLLWPEWQYRRLPQLLLDAISRNRNYFAAILQEYRLGKPPHEDDLDYRIARRVAHRADSALVTAWRDMQVEPKKYQAFSDEAYRLTHLNHALLSYISAFGAHKAQHGHLDAETDALAQAILLFFENADQTNGSNRQEIASQRDELLRQLKNALETNSHDLARQQLLLLYNICELAGKLMEKGINLRETAV